jgi:polyribonucleotide nucleotidyltransferase
MQANLIPNPFSRLAEMARPARTAVIAALGAVSVAALSACGGEDAKLLPGHTAREITANLEAVQQLSDEGDCVGAEGAATQVSEQIEALGGVDRKLKEALANGAERLNEVVAECEEAEEPETAAPPEVTPEEPQQEAEEEAGKKAEKEEEKAEKEREKEEREEEKEAPPAPPEGGPGPSEGPPGQEKTPPGQEKKEAPSGGVESANPAEGEQGG